MQTRRKSLNLGDLGVIAPKRSRTSSHPSPPATILESNEERPIKKSKRSHGSESPSSAPPSPPRATTIRIKEEPRSKVTSALSPPPSPIAEGGINKVDTQGIHDEIVVAAIQQLERTGNRPHLVKELAAILANNLHIIEKSANPCALISSRLTAYLNRSWPAISPCPLAKDLSPVHPRRLYFYLTTSPRQPIPDTIEQPPKPNRIISPSLSSASAADEEERFTRDRHALSPSPEVDLSSPELEIDPMESSESSYSSSRARDRPNYHRRASPPLEIEERDFKQTASALHEQAQRNSMSAASRRSSSEHTTSDTDMDAPSNGDKFDMDHTTHDDVAPSIESEERKNSEAAVALFGGGAEHFAKDTIHQMEFSSPLLQPQSMNTTDLDEVVDSTSETRSLSDAGRSTEDTQAGMDVDDASYLTEGYAQLKAAFELDDALLSCEKVEMAELEDMFDAY